MADKWLARYRQAKFRGINFFVPTADNSGGRRAAIFEFPNQDTPYVEDMGRKVRRFSIEAIVVDDDYIIRRDQLIRALEKRGVGKLVHPYIGTLDVICLDYTYNENSRDGRIATFSLQFIEAGDQTVPNTIIDTTGDVALKKANLLDAAKAWYVKAFEALQKLNRSVKTQMNNLTEMANKSADTMTAAKKTVAGASAFRRDIENLKNKLETLVYDAADLAGEFSDLITFGTNENDDEPATSSNAGDQLEEMKDLFVVPPVDIINADDPSFLFSTFFEINSITNALGLMSIMPFASVEESEEARKIVFEALDEKMLETDDDDLYVAMDEMKTAVMRDLSVRAADLPRLGQYTPNMSLPAIVISHLLYGTIDEEQDLIDRNKIAHPNFVPGAVPLEVKILG